MPRVSTVFRTVVGPCKGLSSESGWTDGLTVDQTCLAKSSARMSSLNFDLSYVT